MIGCRAPLLVLSVLLLAPQGAVSQDPGSGTRSWLAGDHHIHSRFSVGWDRDTDPPTPILGGDAIYPIPRNAEMARRFGLKWMVSTDHGGPNHSKVNLELAYPELLESRTAVPEVIQFYGMEFDVPAGEHASLIIPHTHDEADALFKIERRYARNEPHPAEPGRNTEPFMLEALSFMASTPVPPVLIANHPARTATDLGVFGAYMPEELRNWNDTAPHVAIGMEGAPGHQAAALDPDGSIDTTGARGGYRRYPTMGGFDQMTARLGGFWDSMLGEGRRWWITSTSDSHVHWREGGADFWPGEYSKTFVFAEHTHDDILDGIRNGRVFAVTGDLISELWVTVRALQGGASDAASIGGALHVHKEDLPGGLEVTIRFRDPDALNAGGLNPEVARVDLIVGDMAGPAADRTVDTNPTTRVAARFTEADWAVDGEYRTVTTTLSADGSLYVRVRGTNTSDLEPGVDPRGEDPWSDLWFYSNPIFVEVH